MSNPLGSSLNTTMSSLSNTMNNMGNTLGNSINGLKTSMPGIAGGLATNDATPNTINNLQANSVNRKEFRNQTKDALLDPLGKLLLKPGLTMLQKSVCSSVCFRGSHDMVVELRSQAAPSSTYRTTLIACIF